MEVLTMDHEQQQTNADRRAAAIMRWIEKAPRPRPLDEHGAPPRLPTWARRTPSRFHTYQATWMDA
jgi:hypothetical protein